MEREKELFIEIYRQKMGIMTAACNAANVGRSTIFRWRKEDEEFDKALQAVHEERLDFAESALLRKIQSGDTASILFYLKTQGRERGYVERQSVEVDTAVDEELKEMAKRFFATDK